MSKKLKRIDRDIDLNWKKFGVGYNEGRRDIWIEIDDELGFAYRLRLTKKQARSIAGKMLDSVDTLDALRDNRI